MRRPLQRALARAWADLRSLPLASARADAAPDEFWRRDVADGHVYLNADLLAQAADDLHGAAFIGRAPETARGGFFQRLQTQGVIRRAQAQVDAVAVDTPNQARRLAEWLLWVRRLRWHQADLLQVMEELEPRAEGILGAYFILVAGLSAARTGARRGHYSRMARVPVCGYPGALCWDPGLAIGRSGLCPQRPGISCERRTRADSHIGHRGIYEARPDAQRWYDHLDLLRQWAELPQRHTRQSARGIRDEAERRLWSRLDGGRRRQIEPLLARTRSLCRALDVTWDGFVRVMAAAQAWVEHMGSEAAGAGLLADAADIHFLEFEELKQIATGEWHGGHRHQARAAVAQRRADNASDRSRDSGHPVPTCSLAPLQGDPFTGAIWRMAIADPGAAAGWLTATAILDEAGDAWSHGMLIARCLGIPIVDETPYVFPKRAPPFACGIIASRLDLDTQYTIRHRPNANE